MQDDVRPDGQPIVELPTRRFVEHSIELNSDEQRAYKKVHQEARSALFQNPLKLAKQAPKSKPNILTSMLQLRQLCCHLELGTTRPCMTHPADDGHGAEDINDGSGDALASAFGQLSVASSHPGAPVKSSKLEMAMGLLRPLVKEEAPEGGCNKIVIISQWTGFLELVKTPPPSAPRFSAADGVL